MSSFVVVLPTHCQELHDKCSLWCWCKPYVELYEETSTWMIVHNNPEGDKGTEWEVTLEEGG